MNKKLEIIHLQEVDSTNNYAHKLLDENKKNICNTVIYTDFQTSGRGAYQNKWESKNGENLLFSIILCPDIHAKNQFIISKITSLSLISFLKEKKINTEIKWPNDILAQNKKIAGILIENSIMGDKISESVIGVGLNINQTVFSETLNAVSLKILKNKSFDIKNELDIFLSHFEKYKNHILKNEFEIIDNEYFSNLIGTKYYLTYKKNSETFEAIIEKIDEFGRIIVKLKSGEIKTFGFKEIELIY